MFIVHKEMGKITKTFRLSEDLFDKLNKIAKTNKISVNNLVEQMCNYALSEMKKKG